MDKNTVNIHSPKESMTHRTLNGLFWMFSGAGAQIALRLLIIGILSRLLTPSDFGVLAIAHTVESFSMIFSQIGIGPAIVQRKNLEKQHIQTGFVISIILGSFFTWIIWLCAPLASNFFRIEALSTVLKGMSIVFIIKGLSLVAESLLQRRLKFKVLAIIEVISYTIGYGVIGIFLAYMKFGVWALVWAVISQGILKSAIMLILQPHAKKLSFDLRACKGLLNFGVGYSIANIANHIALEGDKLVVGRYLGPGQIGLYSRSYQMMGMPASLFGGIIDKVLFPVMSKVQDDTVKMAKAYRRGVALVSLVVLPSSAVMLVLAPEIVNFLLGSQWTDAIVPFQILITGMLFRTSYKISSSVARAMGAVYRRAWRQIVYAFFVIVGAFIGCHYGIIGVSVGIIAALTANFILMAHLSLTLTQMTWRSFWVAHVPGVSIATIVGGMVWACVSVSRAFSLPSMVVLFEGIIVAMIMGILMVRMVPQTALGSDGIWMTKTLLDVNISKFGFIRRLLGSKLFTS